MLISKLHELARDLTRLESNREGDSWDHAALQDINERMLGLLSETTAYLEQLTVELGARKELQELLKQLKHSQAKTRTMLWKEQVHFYQQLINDVQEYFKDDGDAYISISLTALEILFFIRLLLEEGIIQTESLQPIFRFLSAYTGTAQHSRLSFESLKKRYSARHAHTRKKVRALLLNLIRRIDQMTKDV